MSRAAIVMQNLCVVSAVYANKKPQTTARAQVSDLQQCIPGTLLPGTAVVYRLAWMLALVLSTPV